ncbi:MAG: glutathione S-transferase family protein [Pseudomonadales bacterium]|nr:glutathione S-transferase family protein [Pseudomonadales bacterium]MCP5182321.1 glutathione S-transferase family protein [Pseudomonadales bacterium]
MITVLGRRNSMNVQKVMWTLGELNLPYRREDVGGSFGYPPGYPNPMQVVPTIRDGDLVVWESNACVRHLARTYGTGTLWPDDVARQAQADMWTEWQRSDISNAFFPLFTGLIRGFATTPEKLERGAKESGRLFGQLDTWLQGRMFITGDTLSIADICIGAMMYRYMTMPIERPTLANLASWYHRLTERPAYRRHVMVEYGRNPGEWAQREQENAGIQ